MKKDPLAVPSDVVVIKSTSGGGTLEAVFQSTREQSKALHADGFAWCKEDMVLLRVHVLPDATVADLVAIGALCASYAMDECLLRTRAFLCPYAFGGVHQACKAGGFAFRKGVGWLASCPAFAAASAIALTHPPLCAGMYIVTTVPSFSRSVHIASSIAPLPPAAYAPLPSRHALSTIRSADLQSLISRHRLSAAPP